MKANETVQHSSSLSVIKCKNPTDARMSTASGLRLCGTCGMWHKDWTVTEIDYAS